MSQILIPPNQDIQNRVVTPDENGLVVIKRDLGIGLPARFYYRFTGTGGDLAAMVPWTPTTHPFEIAFDVFIVAVGASSFWVVGDEIFGTGPGVRITTSNIQYYYQRTEGLIIDQIFPGYELATHYRCRIRQTATLYESEVNGFDAGVAGTSIIGSALESIGNRVAGDQPLNGYIANLLLADEGNSANTSFYPMDEGTGDKFIDAGGRGSTATITGNFNEANWIKF